MSVLLKPDGLEPNPTVRPLTVRQAQAFMDIDPIMRQLGLSLFCVKCHKLFGAGRDGVVMQNAPGDKTIRIDCGCTHRVLQVRA